MHTHPHLKPGDKVTITAVSSPCNQTKLDAGVKLLESLGLKVHVAESCRQTHPTAPYLAATDRKRAADLHTAFADPYTKAIFAARGGYGAARILPLLDFELIKKNPKPFIGFSDATALHIALNQICNISTYHGPMPAANLSAEADALTLESLKYAVFGNPAKPPAMHFKTLVPGEVTAPLIGGNLSVATASLGTPYEIDTRGKILFLEEIDEPPYRIDRMFLQLKQAGKFRDAAGIALGDFSPETAETLHTAIAELILPTGKPTICNIQCGHTSPTLTLPMGIMVSLHQLQKCVH